MGGRSLLLDTHVVIWMASTPDRLPVRLRKAIETVESRFVSHVSAWEIQVKHERHGARFGFSLGQLEQTMKAFACTALTIDYEDIRGLDEMRFLHPDPFDRLLMSQARRRSILFATSDERIVRTYEMDKAFPMFTDRTHLPKR